MTHISLVLYIITDDIVRTIVNSCPLSVELELISKPFNDLSNQGVQSLVACRCLTSLSLTQRQQHIFTSFRRTTDIDMILLSEGLQRPLVEVKLASCSSITSEGVRELANSCTLLEVLDLLDCKSVSNPCISNNSFLTFLTSLNLGGTNVTDAGMTVLGKSNAPISCLSLRGCKRVTDEEITYLLEGEGKIGKTLSSLDLGHMPGITDNAITTIVDVCVGLLELCIRNCFHVTDETIKALALRGSLQDGK
ncbi:F-box domain, cyclin-like protein [Tanacetum coccineum]